MQVRVRSDEPPPAVCAVAVLFRHRALDPEGGRSFDQPEVSIYEVRDGLVVRSQMFHADSAAVTGFLEEAGRSADAGESA